MHAVSLHALHVWIAAHNCTWVASWVASNAAGTIQLDPYTGCSANILSSDHPALQVGTLDVLGLPTLHLLCCRAFQTLGWLSNSLHALQMLNNVAHSSEANLCMILQPPQCSSMHSAEMNIWSENR
jgi:hypothetical protein